MYGDVPDPLKMCDSNVGFENLIVHLEDKVKRMYTTFLQQPMAEFTDM